MLLTPTDPATWRPQGATPTGSFMGSCDVAAGTASFTWYKKVYNISTADGAGNAQVLYMNATSPSTIPPPIPGDQSPIFIANSSASCLLGPRSAHHLHLGMRLQAKPLPDYVGISSVILQGEKESNDAQGITTMVMSEALTSPQRDRLDSSVSAARRSLCFLGKH